MLASPVFVWQWVLRVCVLLYVVIVAVLVLRIIAGASYKPFTNDAAFYSAGAMSIVTQRVYSVNGVDPTNEREPGYSVFLAPIFLVFGRDALPAVALVQAGLLLAAVHCFVRSARHVLGQPITITTACLLLLSPAVFRIVCTPYREAVTLSLLIFLAALHSLFVRNASWLTAAGMGLLLSVLSLTYSPFLLLPFLFVGIFVYQRLSKRFLLAVLLIPCITVLLWSWRNERMLGRFEFIGAYHTASFLQTRALQVTSFTLADPALCLWREYVSRQLDRQKTGCYIQFADGDEAAYHNTIRESIRAILSSLPMFTWEAAFSALEYHFPYVGWGRPYNLAEFCVTLIISYGVLLSIRSMWNPQLAFYTAILLYHLSIFMLLPALPRFRMTVYVSYVVLAATGYTLVCRFLHRCFRRRAAALRT